MEVVMVVAGALLGIGGVGLGGYAAVKKSERKNREKDAVDKARHEQMKRELAEMKRPLMNEAASPKQPPETASPLTSSPVRPHSTTTAAPTLVEVPFNRDVSKRLLKVKREFDRGAEEHDTYTMLQEMHPSINIASTLSPEKHSSPTKNLPKNVRKYNVKLDYAGELLGIKWRADSYDDPVEIYGMEPNKAGVRNHIPQSGFLLSIAGLPIHNADEMAVALKHVRNDGLKDFDVYLSEESPKGMKIEVAGGKTHPVVDEVVAEWIEEQEDDRPKKLAPLIQPSVERPTGYGNSMNKVKLGETVFTGPSQDYAECEKRARQKIDAIHPSKAVATVPFSKNPRTPTTPAHLHRHSTPGSPTSPLSSNKYHVCPWPEEPLVQHTRTAPSLSREKLDIVGHPSVQFKGV